MLKTRVAYIILVQPDRDLTQVKQTKRAIKTVFYTSKSLNYKLCESDPAAPTLRLVILNS